MNFFSKIWQAIKNAFAKPSSPVLVLASEAPKAVAPVSAIPWRDWYIARLGWNESNKANVTELSKGWKYTNVPSYNTIVGSTFAWCSMTLCTALEENGYKSTRDASAISFKDYGIPSEIKPGAIIVIQHASGAHHVTTFDSWVDQENHLARFLGGNQSDSICIATYNVSGNKAGHDEIIAIRWPVKA